MIRIVDARDTAAVATLLWPDRDRDGDTDQRVATIVADVRSQGEPALLRYAREFDRLDGPVEVSRKEMLAAAKTVAPAVRHAMRVAAKNIRTVAARQVPRGWRVTVGAGITVEQRVIPLDRVGCYVPGGRYPLPSTLLMTVIPARAAGVKDVIVACPKPDAVVMAAALEAGATRVFRLGGAQAIAAMAYGTQSVPRVDKIVGPGNRYVAAAKALVAADCGIDFYAGPTEIVIVATGGNPAWVAADLIAQAEHDPDARAVVITTNRSFASQVADVLEQTMPATGPAAESIHAHGGIIVTKSTRDAMALANHAAAEHLVVDDERMASQVTSAGSVFVGGWSAQVAGDYAIGSNHVLPTAGAARVRGGLSAADFVKQITVQRVSRRGLTAIGPSVIALAEAEGLTAHAASIAARLAKRSRSA
jgi:histidinol dehydrogenase